VFITLLSEQNDDMTGIDCQ